MRSPVSSDPGKGAAVLFASAVLLLASASHAGPFRVLEDTGRELVLELRAGGWQEHELPGGALHFPAGAGVDDRTGARMAPYYHRLLALPADNRPRVVVEDVRWGERLPGLPPQGSGPEDNLRVEPLYGRGPVVVGPAFEWRRHTVANLFVVPIRPDGDGVLPLDYLRFRVIYPDPRGSLTTRSDRLVEAAVVNPSSARAWTLPRAGSRGTRTAGAAAAWPDGIMVRIEIEDEGIYQISPADLEVRGIDAGGFDPRKFRLFNNGGQPLPESPAVARPDSLIENAIIVEGEGDGSFDAGDRIIFYGRSVNTWVRAATPGSYVHTNNPFTRRNVYWLNIPADGPDGKRMQPIEVNAAATFETEIARSRLFIERDAVIFNSKQHPESGTRWFATELTGGEQYSAGFELESPLAAADGELWVYFKRLDGFGSNAIVSVNGAAIDTFSLTTTKRSMDVPAALLRSGSNTFSFRIDGGRVYFDWIELSYLRRLETNAGRIVYDALPQDGVARVSISGLEDPWVFDVQDYANVRYTRNVPYEAPSQVNDPRRMIAVSDANLRTPATIEQAGFGDDDYPNGLRDPNLAHEYIFIYHPDFTGAVAQLEAYVEQRDELDVLPVNINDVFQEFSWGLYDPTAIRDFLMYAYDNWATLPQTVLLVGDGDYDYRNISSSADKNWIPPYENAHVSRDDWYAEFGSGEPQIAMGRLTVQTNGELETYLEKLQRYENDSDLGAWRSKLVMLADDEYIETGPTFQDQIHMEQAEEFSTEAAPPFISIKKIYIGAYPTTFDPVTGGRRKPDATRALLNEINRGALLVSFIGHGNAHVWTHESVLLDSRDNALIDSGDRTPLYLAATCSWAHFDRPQNPSHPELLLVKPGGAIGVVGATRLTNAYSNNRFALAFYERIFDRTAAFSVGEALFLAKLDHPEGTNQYYHCLAEPNLRLALPRMDVEFTGVEPDSLTALAPAEVSGEVTEPNGGPLPDFDGEAVVTVYDGADTLAYAFTGSGGEPVDTLHYSVTGGTLFRGLVTVTGGELDAGFIVPRDVKSGSRDGSVHMYAYNDELDGVGAAGGMLISNQSASLDDNTPPEVTVYFDHPNWREGDLTSATPVLYVALADSSGINLTGEIGHDIRAVIDGSGELLLTESFTYERDSYTRGVAEERIFDLEPGRHQLELWAWDNANNFTRAQTSFTVVSSDEAVALNNVLNWPNPFSERTNFTFGLLGADAEVTIKIYTASGRKIREIGPIAGRAGFNYPERTSFELEWDGRDDYGDPVANGAYLYVVKATGPSGQSDEAVGKLLRIR
ncbi:MAG: hypothetical protein MAG453_01714 [Calditrichaeota bacterium]|nr:hypothetical protein [Calditrichota bacterium]